MSDDALDNLLRIQGVPDEYMRCTCQYGTHADTGQLYIHTICPLHTMYLKNKHRARSYYYTNRERVKARVTQRRRERNDLLKTTMNV